jgi:hypothetical protein
VSGINLSRAECGIAYALAQISEIILAVRGLWHLVFHGPVHVEACFLASIMIAEHDEPTRSRCSFG